MDTLSMSHILMGMFAFCFLGHDGAVKCESFQCGEFREKNYIRNYDLIDPKDCFNEFLMNTERKLEPEPKSK